MKGSSRTSSMSSHPTIFYNPPVARAMRFHIHHALVVGLPRARALPHPLQNTLPAPQDLPDPLGPVELSSRSARPDKDLLNPPPHLLAVDLRLYEGAVEVEYHRLSFSHVDHRKSFTLVFMFDLVSNRFKSIFLPKRATKDTVWIMRGHSQM